MLLCLRLWEQKTDSAPDERGVLTCRCPLQISGVHKTAGKGSKPAQPKDVAEEVERISASWARLGPALGEEARALTERFERALASLSARKSR